MNRVWTEDELEILRRDREAKVPVPVTAAKLGRPVPATYARARLIGTLVQPHQSWDEASVGRLRELVTADPPMTDKVIAAELGRTVTQIRWKMQDLGLIGMRDLSKLAKITAAGTARPKTAQSEKPRLSPAAPALRQPSLQSTSPREASVDRAATPVRSAEPAERPLPRPMNAEEALILAIKDLEASLAEHLKNAVAESEAGMIRAARAAIAEKARIDQRLLVRVKRSAEAAARRDAEARQAAEDTKRKAMEARNAEADVRKALAAKAEAEAKRKAEDAAAARRAREAQAREEMKRLAAQIPAERIKPAEQLKPAERPRAAEKPRAAIKPPVLPAVRGISQVAPLRPAPQPAAPIAPKILVSETPAAMRPVEPEQSNAHTSGRGGWKSVRRDPGRVMAQAKAKAKPANRADAVDLAQAAQAAIERFIAERGVTRTETSGIPAVVSRLQARGYIVVRDESGWTIDQRHRIDSESELVAFAEARGIAMSAAA